MFPEEAERIIQCQGRVFCLHDEPGVHRVWLPDEESPGLAMSRAFGDYCVKDFGLVSVPEVTQRHITSEDQFAVLATDGVSMILFINLALVDKCSSIGNNIAFLLRITGWLKITMIPIRQHLFVLIHKAHGIHLDHVKHRPGGNFRFCWLGFEGGKFDQKPVKPAEFSRSYSSIFKIKP